MSTFRDISKTLKRALLTSPVATLHSYNNGKISLQGFGLTAAFDFLSNFDADTHPAEQISQSISAAFVGMFLPHILSNLVESCIGDPQVSLALALTMTTLALKYGIDICDKLAPPIKKNVIARKPLTRDEELKRIEKFMEEKEVSEKDEDDWLTKNFPNESWGSHKP